MSRLNQPGGKVVLCLLLLAEILPAVSVSQIALGAQASEDRCTIAATSNSFSSTLPQIFLRLVLADIRTGDQALVEWVDPTGHVSLSTPYDQLPPVGSLCLVTQLPVGGFPPAQSPGVWAVRVSINNSVRARQTFRMEGSAVAGLRITKVSTRENELVLEGEGFNTESTIHLAQYTSSGQWTYLSHLFPKSLEPSRVTIPIGPLKPAEYVVFVRNGQTLSLPARFLIATTGGYRMPFRPGELWVISQGPYGSYSHWGRTVHAYDIAPRAGSCVVAMRGGIVHAFDPGYGQTPHVRIFGNYITIDHGDGEFSHYGHLKSRSFLVRTGDRVEQGQPLAIAGNSGFSFGTHVHAQVTKSMSISSQSIPFRFEELSALGNHSYRGPIQSANHSPFGPCGAGKPASPQVLVTQTAQPGASAPDPTWGASIGLAEWWSELIAVSSGAKSLEVSIAWDDGARDLDLHLMSPVGRHFSPHADATGFSQTATAKTFRIESPESGTWRVSVQAVKGTGRQTAFRVYRTVDGGGPAWGGARRR